METKKQTYYSKMKDIKRRYENNEQVSEDELIKMNKYFDKKNNYDKIYSKNYYSKMKDIKRRYENNEQVPEDEFKLMDTFYKKLYTSYANYKAKIDYNNLYKKYYEKSKLERLEAAKIKYNNKTKQEKTKYYYDNRDEILKKMKNKYKLLRDKLLEYNKEYRLKKQKEKYAELYEHGKQILSDIMELNLGYSINF
jgi:hypothetical protein